MIKRPIQYLAPRYHDRVTRARYAATRYQTYLQGSVLDVGCWEEELANWIPGPYVGIDIAGAPSIRCNLEEGSLPFSDNSFESVVCLDVLEHLDPLHQVFHELIRVAQKYVIISLPNNWPGFLKRAVKSGTGSLKYYGLPPEPPRDRHKWFFNCEDARSFIVANSQRARTSISSLELIHVGICSYLISISRIPDLLGIRPRFDNLFVSALWIVLDKS